MRRTAEVLKFYGKDLTTPGELGELLKAANADRDRRRITAGEWREIMQELSAALTFISDGRHQEFMDRLQRLNQRLAKLKEELNHG